MPRARGECLLHTAIGEILDKIYRLHREDELNWFRDEARAIAKVLGMTVEFTALNQYFSTLLKTGDAKSLVSTASRARAAQTPYHPHRIGLVTKLAGALNVEVPSRLAEGFAPALHFMFLVVEGHPFTAGNGRVARIT